MTELYDRLLVAERAVFAAVAPALAAQGLTRGEWLLLRALYRFGVMPPSALAAALGITRGGVTKVVDRLRARRLVVRAGAGGEDRRYQGIALTGAGAVLAAALAAAEHDAEAALLARLGDRRRAALSELLDALRG